MQGVSPASVTWTSRERDDAILDCGVVTNGLEVAPYCPYFAYYNLGRIHRTLRVTHAMEAGIIRHVWTIQELPND